MLKMHVFFVWGKNLKCLGCSKMQEYARISSAIIVIESVQTNYFPSQPDFIPLQNRLF